MQAGSQAGSHAGRQTPLSPLPGPGPEPPNLAPPPLLPRTWRLPSPPLSSPLSPLRTSVVFRPGWRKVLDRTHTAHTHTHTHAHTVRTHTHTHTHTAHTQEHTGGRRAHTGRQTRTHTHASPGPGRVLAQTPGFGPETAHVSTSPPVWPGAPRQRPGGTTISISRRARVHVRAFARHHHQHQSVCEGVGWRGGRGATTNCDNQNSDNEL